MAGVLPPQGLLTSTWSALSGGMAAVAVGVLRVVLCGAWLG